MMMSQDQTLVKLKKDVRSLLLSSKLGLSAEQLRKDYVCMLGQRMPLKELGFRSILDMAKEMPEVVSFIYLEDGSFVLKAVSDESTEGINQLVSKQRLTKNKRGYLRSFPMRYPHPMAPIILPRWGRAPPALPAQLRAQLRQLISQGPLRLSEMERRFQQCFGHPLRYTDYGFYSLGDMLARVPDLCILYTRMGSVVSFKQPDQPGPRSRPQSPVTESVKPEAIRPSPCLSSPLNPKTGLLQPGQSSAPSQCSPSQRTTSVTQNSLVPSCKSWDPIGNGSERVPDNGPPQQLPGPEPQQPYQDGQLLEKFMFKLETELRQKILENGDADSVSPELKDKLQKVVGDHSQGLSVHDLPTHYKRVFGEELPVLQSGFLSVTQLVAGLSDIFHMEPAGGTKDPHWIVKNLSNKHTESAECGGEEGRRREGCLYQSIRRSLWEQHEDDDEEEEEDQPDPTTCLTSILANQQLVELYPAVQVRSSSMVPLDAVRGQRLRPPTRRWPRALAAVLVEQVESPGSFHVRFSESQEARSLEDMMMEMRGCYNCSGVAARYRLPERYLRPGQVCCVAPRDLWFYRVVVQRVLSLDQVEVYYVDFGDLNLVSVDKLMFLKSCYSQLPAQAVPAMLTGVQPISGNWSAVATASFQSLCSDRTLVAVLHGYHCDSLQLFLCDTRTEDDRYVHTVLLEQGHARPCWPPSTTVSSQTSNPGGVRDCLKSLYLREGLINLEDEEENATTTRTPQPITGQHCQYSVLEEESLPEPPGLELVEAFHNSTKTLNLCESWLERNPCSEGDQTWASGGSVEDSRPPSFTTLPELAPDHQPMDLTCVSQVPPLICNGNLATTSTSPEEDSRPGVDPGPAVIPEACRAPMTSLVSSLPPILTSLSLLTPGLAKGCFYGMPGTTLQSTGPAMSFPLFGGRSVAIASRKCD